MTRLSFLLVATLVGPAMAVPFDDCPAPGTVSRLDASQGAVSPAEAPSPAPSSAHICTTQTSNARGHYTSTLAPCIFKFHTIEEEDFELIDYQTSDLCNADNAFLIMKEYVYDWRDECVGDFSRCYSLKHHKHILFDFLCAMDWKIPPSTTHVSVDCMEDKDLVLEAESKSSAADRHERNQERLDRVELKLFNVALVLGSCLAGIYVISKWIVKPLVAQSALQLDQGYDRSICTCSSFDACTCRQNLWVPSQRVSLEVEGSEHPEYDSAVHYDFDMQVPADFDAVPIVPATILPDVD